MMNELLSQNIRNQHEWELRIKQLFREEVLRKRVALLMKERDDALRHDAELAKAVAPSSQTSESVANGGPSPIWPWRSDW